MGLLLLLLLLLASLFLVPYLLGRRFIGTRYNSLACFVAMCWGGAVGAGVVYLLGEWK